MSIMRVLPIWAKIPKHKNKVIATSRGWVVESTGEVLVSVKGLDKKLIALNAEIKDVPDLNVVAAPVTLREDVSEPTPVVVSEVEEPATEEVSEAVTEEVSEEAPEAEEPAPKKRRGRPAKNAKANASK